MDTLFIALGVGIAAYILFVLAIPKAVPSAADDYIRHALDRIAEENRERDEAHEQVLRDQLHDAPPIVQLVFGMGLFRPIYEAGLQAGYQHDMQRLLVMMLLAFGGGLLGGFAIGIGALLSIALALILAYLVPYRHCNNRVTKRNRAFIDQFPDALDMIVRSVRSGFPLSVAMQMLAENAEEPVRGEFRQVTDEIAMGRTLQQALARLALRINEPDVRFFVVVLSVQQETGGNLSEIISNLSGIIRKRKQIRNKIRAMTSEGKATGYVLGGLPIFVFAALYAVQPQYLQPFFNDHLGQLFFCSAIVLIITCYFVIQQMIKVDI